MDEHKRLAELLTEAHTIAVTIQSEAALVSSALHKASEIVGPSGKMPSYNVDRAYRKVDTAVAAAVCAVCKHPEPEHYFVHGIRCHMCACDRYQPMEANPVPKPEPNATGHDVELAASLAVRELTRLMNMNTRIMTSGDGIAYIRNALSKLVSQSNVEHNEANPAWYTAELRKAAVHLAANVLRYVIDIPGVV